jgi:hypothetical protein
MYVCMYVCMFVYMYVCKLQEPAGRLFAETSRLVRVGQQFDDMALHSRSTSVSVKKAFYAASDVMNREVAREKQIIKICLLVRLAEEKSRATVRKSTPHTVLISKDRFIVSLKPMKKKYQWITRERIKIRIGKKKI